MGAFTSSVIRAESESLGGEAGPGSPLSVYRSRPVGQTERWKSCAGTELVSKNPDGLDLKALLDRIKREMGSAPEPTRWTMNFCLAAIGIDFAEHRQRASDSGEGLGGWGATGLSLLQRLHVSVRSHLDQRDGIAPGGGLSD